MLKKKMNPNPFRALLIVVIPMTLVTFIGCKESDSGSQDSSSIADLLPEAELQPIESVESDILKDVPLIDEVEDEDEEMVEKDGKEILHEISKIEEEDLREEIKHEIEEIIEDKQDKDKLNSEINEEFEQEEELASQDPHKRLERMKGRRKTLKLRKLKLRARVYLRKERIKAIQSDIQDFRKERAPLLSLIKALKIKRKEANKEQRLEINDEINDIREFELEKINKKISNKRKIKNRIRLNIKKLRTRIKKINNKLKRLRKRIKKLNN